MTDIALPARAPAWTGPRFFYFHMSLVCLAVAFLGFLPTYWMPMAAGALKADATTHIHGMVFFAWSVFLVFQTWIAATGQYARHRSTGLIGVSLVTAMAILGVIISIHLMKAAAASGHAEAGLQLAIVPLSNIALFVGLMILAFINIRRPEWHKRLMTIGALSILGAPIIRPIFVLFHVARPPPHGVITAAEAIAVLLCLIPLVRDWRVLGRVHPAYGWSFVAILAKDLLQATAYDTAAWRSVAGWVAGLAG